LHRQPLGNVYSPRRILKLLHTSEISSCDRSFGAFQTPSVFSSDVAQLHKLSDLRRIPHVADDVRSFGDWMASAVSCR